MKHNGSLFGWGTLVVVAVLSVGVFATVTYNSIMQGVGEFYAIWGCHDAISVHIADNDGEWPNSWDDLTPSFEQCNRSSKEVAEYRKLVVINFRPNATIGGSRLISLLDGTKNGEIENANTRLRKLLFRPSTAGTLKQ